MAGGGAATFGSCHSSWRHPEELALWVTAHMFQVFANTTKGTVPAELLLFGRERPAPRAAMAVASVGSGLLESSRKVASTSNILSAERPPTFQVNIQKCEPVV